METNKLLLKIEEENRNQLRLHPTEYEYLYPNLNDPNFNIKIAQKKEFSDTKYDGEIHNIKEYADLLSKAEFELSPHQAFVRNFMSFQTPYNSMLLYHALGSGKTCSAIGVAEEMRDYYRQMGINKRIIVVASPNVQDNFKLQLFDERKLKLVDGIWSIKGCIGNKLLKEINPTSMRGLTKEKIVYQVKTLINASYSFMGYTQFSNEITRVAGDNMTYKNRNIQEEYNNTLIIIDEVHNIRISDDNENKDIAKNLMYLVMVAQNVRLLLLSATPMFNNYKEIVWILNLMNMNDRRGLVGIKEIFDNEGNFKEGSGKELFIRKATGYISYVRGENPYTFPFRVYPNLFAPDHIFKTIEEYPKYQLNCKLIPNDKKISKTIVYLTKIGDYQKWGYAYMMDRLRKKKVNNFEEMERFGYTDLQLPLESLNIIYPMDDLEEMVKELKPCVFVNIEENKSLSLKETEYDETESEKELNDIISIVNESESEQTINEIIQEPEENSSSESSSNSSDSSSSETSSSSSRSINEEQNTNNCLRLEEEIRILTEQLNKCKNISKKRGGAESQDDRVYMDVKELTGTTGIKRIMKFQDKKSFEYRPEIKEKYGNIFGPNNIGKYSAKIKSICENIYNTSQNSVSSGIILIYSAYIDGGLIPMALALEEMGFSRYGSHIKSLFKTAPTELVDVRTMKPPTNKKDFLPARYVMITGDIQISPNNVIDVNSLTGEDNINGNKIKVVLISQAGSEGLDFKTIRQIHIMEPWYNMNRIEQIIGRGVRNFSHKDLPFEQRNVEIFLHGTILNNAEEEAVDLYVYRIAELKAIQIGNVTRLLKQTSVDCIVNHDQNEFTVNNFKLLEENRNVQQILSTGLVVDEFPVGDMPNSANCDYMSACEYKCLPDAPIDDSKLNFDTYNETFMLVNSDKIIQKIKGLMKMRYFYKKKDLFHYLNIPKPYPIAQIYAALTQLIEDRSEYILDRYGRTGYLINIGEYYLFQPSELNYHNISIYDRSVPLDYKHNMIQFDIKHDIVKTAVVDKRKIPLEEVDLQMGSLSGKKILDDIKIHYDTARSTNKTARGEDNWYKFCGMVIVKLKQQGISIEVLQGFLIDHIMETLLYNEKIELLKFLHINTAQCSNMKEDDVFITMIKKYFCEKIIHTKNLTAIILFDGPSKKKNLKINILNNNTWGPAEPEDIRDLIPIITEKFKIKSPLNKYIGFIGFEEKQKYMIFKVKDTENTRNTGSRCDQAGKKKTIDLLNLIVGKEEFTKENTKGITQQELCVYQEFILRNYQRDKKDGKTWFLTTENAVIMDG